jgi:hypothetical protein
MVVTYFNVPTECLVRGTEECHEVRVENKIRSLQKTRRGTAYGWNAMPHTILHIWITILESAISPYRFLYEDEINTFEKTSQHFLQP